MPLNRCFILRSQFGQTLLLLPILSGLFFISQMWYNSRMQDESAERKAYPTDLTGLQWKEMVHHGIVWGENASIGCQQIT